MSLTSARQQLHAATEGLYATFARYPLAAHVEGCTHCHLPEEEAIFHVRQLRDLSTEDLSSFAFSALTTWGDEADLKHFLPRLFELAVHSPNAFISVETLFGKLAYSHWHQWPEDEQQAAVSFFDASWRWILAQAPDEAPASAADWLVAIAQALPPAQVAERLTYWTEHLTARAGEHFPEFASAYVGAMLHGNALPDVYWDDREEQARVVLDWLRSTSLLEAVAHAAVNHPDVSVRAKLQEAFDLLALLS